MRLCTYRTYYCSALSSPLSSDYLLDQRQPKRMCEIRSKLTIKTLERSQRHQERMREIRDKRTLDASFDIEN